MDSNNFVAYYDGKKIISGGYVINDMNIVSSLAGGSNNFDDKNIFENDDEFIIFDNTDNNKIKKNDPLYAIPAGLILIDIEKNKIPSSVGINYSPKNVLDDDIFDNLYNSAIVNNNNEKKNEKKKYNNRKKTKKNQKKVVEKKNNKKTKSNKK